MLCVYFGRFNETFLVEKYHHGKMARSKTTCQTTKRTEQDNTNIKHAFLIVFILF